MKHVLCYWPYYTPKPTTPETNIQFHEQSNSHILGA
jgi:hypothetical protein